MNNVSGENPSPLSRRHFLRTSAAVTAAGAVAASFSGVFAAGSDKIRIGLIGCGSRGTGAAANCLASSPGVELIALADVFPDHTEAALSQLKKDRPGAVTATKETCFTGFDAYQQLLRTEVDLVLMATPPHFRPIHLKAAIEAGKNVFMEKPVAVDPTGIRSVLASAERATQQKLAIVAGTQRRHQNAYTELMKRIHDGAIGDIVAGEAYWNGPCVRTYGFYHDRQAGWTDMEFMIRNWYFYSWLSGDHIVEQHVHNLDVINWAIGAPPVEALAVGGRQWRVEPQYGNIYDHFGVRYRYANGAILVSEARQINGTEGRVGEGLIGLKGRASAGRIEGANAWKWEGANPDPYVQEHADLIASIRAGQPLNEGKHVAEATMTAIMARMSAYSGQPVRWDFAMKESQLDLTPKEIKAGGYQLDSAPTVPPPARGNEELV